jgi:DNA-binding response OmpR family regulator
MEASDRPVRVLVVEDDAEIAHVLQRSLRLDGYEVKLASDGVQALDEAHAFLPDVIVLDLGLPRLDGIDVARRLRDDGDDVPILILTARDAVESRVEGLDIGADDYLVKPFEMAELLARIEALLRRGAAPASSAPVGENFRFGDISIDFRKAEVTKSGQPIDLSAREFKLLRYFVEHRGAALSRDELLNEVWGYNAMPSTRTVDVHVAWLRQKIEDNPRHPQYIHTVHGLGYKFVV